VKINFKILNFFEISEFSLIRRYTYIHRLLVTSCGGGNSVKICYCISVYEHHYKIFYIKIAILYKTFIQSGRGTKNPRKRFTLPDHSLKNYGPLNSQTTGKGEK
jgi:hypothetical protein